MKKKCIDCGNPYIGDKDDLWCAGCRKKNHDKMWGILKEGMKDNYRECPKCKSLVKKDIKICMCGKDLR